jgi:hypothetical protein
MLTDDEVLDRAKVWAHLHAKPQTRDKMDQVLDGLSSADQRRVYLCGQRIAGGLKPRVIPAPAQPKERSHNGKTTNDQAKTKRSASDSAQPSTAKPEGKVASGTDLRPKRAGQKGRDPKPKKQ